MDNQYRGYASLGSGGGRGWGWWGRASSKVGRVRHRTQLVVPVLENRPRIFSPYIDESMDYAITVINVLKTL